MRTSAPIKLNVFLPKTQAGQEILARRVATAHADLVVSQLKQLSASPGQKRKVIDDIVRKKTYNV